MVKDKQKTNIATKTQILFTKLVSKTIDTSFLQKNQV